MKNLRVPKINCFSEFELILQSKVKKTQNSINGVKSQIQDRYLEYDKAFYTNNLATINHLVFRPSIKKELLGCYSNSTIPLEKLIISIKNAQDDNLKSICQYCGIDSDESIDHYLPKGKYPEFCVKQLNLIPCCPTCNSLKGQYWLDNLSKARGILNLYSDILPSRQYVFVKLNYSKRKCLFKAKFYLKNDGSIDDSLFTLIENHYKKLRLLKRYECKFGKVFSQTVSIFDRGKSFRDNPTLVREILFDEAESLGAKYGVNYYKSVIKMQLANNSNFVNMF